jgi:hypothetical protein
MPNTSATAAVEKAVTDRSLEVSIRIGLPKLLRCNGQEATKCIGEGAGVQNAVPGLRHHL